MTSSNDPNFVEFLNNTITKKQNIINEREKKVKEQKQKYIDIVCSQTDYTCEQAKEKLKEFNYDYVSVIRHYMNPNYKNTQSNTTNQKVSSVNQEIYKQLRSFMDYGCKKYEQRKQLQEYYKNNKQT